MVHLRFVCELYQEQLRHGRYFLHDHLAQASSWAEGCIKEVMQAEGVDVITADQCMPGIPAMIESVQVEATFPDGTKLVTVHHPIREAAE